jgi:hypothetical protein
MLTTLLGCFAIAAGERWRPIEGRRSMPFGGIRMMSIGRFSRWPSIGLGIRRSSSIANLEEKPDLVPFIHSYHSPFITQISLLLCYPHPNPKPTIIPTTIP